MVTGSRSFIPVDLLGSTNHSPYLVCVQYQLVLWNPILQKYQFLVLFCSIFISSFFCLSGNVITSSWHPDTWVNNCHASSANIYLWALPNIGAGRALRRHANFALPHVNMKSIWKLHFTGLLCTNDCIAGKYLVKWQFCFQLERVKAMVITTSIH